MTNSSRTREFDLFTYRRLIRAAKCSSLQVNSFQHEYPSYLNSLASTQALLHCVADVQPRNIVGIQDQRSCGRWGINFSTPASLLSTSELTRLEHLKFHEDEPEKWRGKDGEEEGERVCTEFTQTEQAGSIAERAIQRSIDFAPPVKELIVEDNRIGRDAFGGEAVEKK